jgi:hypothetical protein
MMLEYCPDKNPYTRKIVAWRRFGEELPMGKSLE